MSHLELLEAELRRFDLQLPASQVRLLGQYCDVLVHWNQRMNLTGLRGAEMVRRLVAEPVWVGEQLKMHGVLVDIGSGNGSPALPLRLVRRFARVHLFESRARRAAFLRHVISSLKLDRVTIHAGRFEAPAGNVGTADWVTLQAVALTSKLAASIRRVCSSGTTVVWMTAPARSPMMDHPFKILPIPGSNNAALLYRLDLS